MFELILSRSTIKNILKTVRRIPMLILRLEGLIGQFAWRIVVEVVKGCHHAMSH